MAVVAQVMTIVKRVTRTSFVRLSVPAEWAMSTATSVYHAEVRQQTRYTDPMLG